MKDTNRVFRFIAAVAAAIICFVSCDETEGGGETLATFGVELKEAGPGYVDLNVNVPAPLEVAYSIGSHSSTMTSPGGSQTGWEVEGADTAIFIFIIRWGNKKILSTTRSLFIIEYRENTIYY